MRKILTLLLAMCFCMGITSNVFAAETVEGKSERQIFATDDNTKVVYEDAEKALVEYTVEPRSNNYGSTWVSSSKSSSFTVYTTYSGSLGFTLKTETSDASSWAYLSVKRPNNSYYWNNIYVGANAQVVKTVNNASSGTYTINYSAYTSSGMRIMCWIYKN